VLVLGHKIFARGAFLHVERAFHNTSFEAMGKPCTDHEVHFTISEVILMLPPLGIYIEGEARQATYRRNCSGEFTRARFGHSEVFER
jgi:hypothetical protein